MRYRAILRNFERRAPRPRQLIAVRWMDGESSESWTIEGYGPPEYHLDKSSPRDEKEEKNPAPSDHKPKRLANKPPARKKDRPQ